MAFVLADRVRDTTTTTGTGTVTLSGTSPTGYQTFGDGIGNGNNTYYTINADSQWEVGIGTYSASGTTLSRNTVLASSNGGALVDFAIGIKDVYCDYPAEKAVTDVYGTALAATTAANLAGGAAGSIPYQTAANTTSLLAAGTGVLIGGATPSYTMSPSLTQVTVAGDPTVNLQVATKQYVDTQTSAGIHFHQPVRVESPINLNATYNNGTAGVGATLTNAGTQAALVIDGVTVSVADRVLVYEQTDETQNGIYDVTSVGSGSTNWVLTRSSDADTYVNASPDGLSQGSTVFVQQGTTGAGETYTCNTVGTITFGTTAITFAQISSAQIYSAGTGLTLTGTTFSLTAPVATSLGGTGLTTFTSGGAVYATSASVLTTGTLPATAGGTGQSSYTTGDLLYATSGTALGGLADVATGNALLSGGVGAAPSWGKVGLTTHISGTLAVGNGGTGATSLTGYLVGNGTSAFTATTTIPTSDLSGTISLTTQVSGTLGAGNGGTGISSYTVGDILYASGTTTLASLADVATGNALISGGVSNAPLWGKIGLTTHVSGTLPVSNGGSGATTLTGYLKGNGTSAFTASATIPSGDITGAALTKADDTNVTLTLGGSPSTALLAATSITAGWSGQLAVSRGGTGNSTLASGYLLKGNGVSPTSASVIYDNGTNVGVGTASVSGTYGKLTVAGGVRTVDDTSSKLELGRFSAGAPNSYIKLGANSGSLRFTNAADDTDLMTLTNAGNLGLGTASPTAIGGYKAITLDAGTGTFTDYRENGTLRLRIGGDAGAGFINGSSGTLRLLTSDTDRLTINSSGNVTANVDMRAPIFYDSNNTAYYVDPAGTTVLNGLSVGGLAVLRTYGTINNNIDSDYGEGFVTFDPVPSGTPPIASPNLRTINVGNNYSRRTQVAFDYDTNRTWFRRRTDVWSVWSEYWHSNSPTISATADMRAPIFYDSDNTGYYIDPASTSVTSQINVGTGLNVFDGAAVSPDPYGIVGITRKTDNNYSYLGFTRAGQHAMGMGIDTGNTFWIGGCSSGFNGIRTSSWLLMHSSGYVTAPVDMRAPIFYDSNNTAFYANMDGTSEFNTIQTRGGSGFRSFATPAASVNSQIYFADAGNTRAWNWQLDENNNAALWNYNGSGWAKRMGVTSPDSELFLRNSSGSDVSLAYPATFGYSSSYKTMVLGNQAYTTICIGVSPASNPSGSFNGAGSGVEVMFKNGVNFITPNSANNSYLTPLTLADGYAASTGSFRAPIFYDSDNTGYYVDPASTSVLYQINTGIGINLSGGLALNGSGATLANSIGARLTENYGPLWNCDNSATWHHQVINGSMLCGFTAGGTNWGSGKVVANGDMRAPIFYDYNNTARYFDGTTGINFTTGSSSRVTVYSDDSGLHVANSEGVGGDVRLGAAYNLPGLYNNPNLYLQSESGIYFHTGNTQRGYFDGSSNLFANASMRAPIFYDSNNTAYYLDPNSRSILSNISIITGVTECGIRFRGDTLDFVGRYGGYMSMYNQLTGGEFKILDAGYFNFNQYGVNEASWRAPIFYDSNDTAFYLDPNGTSILQTVSLGLQTWRGDITWNNAVNILVPASAECSFDVATSGVWQVWDSTTGAPMIRAPAGSNVQIGEAGSRGLYVFGGITATGNVTAYSDIRIKANVETIPSALDKLDQIRGVTYTRTDLEDKEQRYAGVIAQEIEAVLPEAVRDLGDIKAVDYNATIGLLIQAVKELTDKVKALEAKEQ